MKTYTIIVSEDIIKKCRKFANDSIESSYNHWKKRNIYSKDRVIEDITIGKIGEWAAYKFLKMQGFKMSKPDLNVYHSKQKSFDADLSCGDISFHCKSQGAESASKYGNSWILQYSGSGRGHQDKLFKYRTDKDFLVPMLVNGDEVTIFGIIKISLLFEENMIELPKLKWFEETKRAIYWDTIKDLKHYDRWGILRRK